MNPGIAGTYRPLKTARNDDIAAYCHYCCHFTLVVDIFKASL
jgi:hypothetical protein